VNIAIIELYPGEKTISAVGIVAGKPLSISLPSPANFLREASELLRIRDYINCLDSLATIFPPLISVLESSLQHGDTLLLAGHGGLRDLPLASAMINSLHSKIDVAVLPNASWISAISDEPLRITNRLTILTSSSPALENMAMRISKHSAENGWSVVRKNVRDAQSVPAHSVVVVIAHGDQPCRDSILVDKVNTLSSRQLLPMVAAAAHVILAVCGAGIAGESRQLYHGLGWRLLAGGIPAVLSAPVALHKDQTSDAIQAYLKNLTTGDTVSAAWSRVIRARKPDSASCLQCLGEWRLKRNATTVEQ